ncbi:MAG: aldehyde dehydrogenase family protein [Chloroflexi bacterium]|nr:aldehyde dehydrogenase family protein [Chloroflexota bacterium]
MARKFLVGGEWRASDETRDVVFPYDGTVVDAAYMASAQDLEDAVVAAQRGFEVTRKLPVHRRAEILSRLYRLLTERYDDLVEALVMETGKAKKIARGETSRACQTVLIASEEAKRIYGEIIDLDWTPAGENHRGYVRRFPVGIVLGITPFNYPLNLACHKIAPAIASGNAMIIKPPEIAPLSSLLLAELVLEAGYPPEAFSMVPTPGPRAEPLVSDDRIAMLSFTGSDRVGWMLKGKAGRKRVALELGGNAPAIIHEDADLDLAISKTVNGGFANAGQNCISVQRILLHRPIYEDFCDRFIPAVGALKIGDPRDETTDIGPLINEKAAQRAAAWVDEAVAEGAQILTGGGQPTGSPATMLAPTVLAEVTPTMKVCAQEVFAPVITLSPYERWDDAIAIANESDFGLQAGVFTRDYGRIMDAWERIEAGGVLINEVSTFRVDQMPYGGVKGSGLGREGIRYTIEEMTERRLLVVNMA